VTGSSSSDRGCGQQLVIDLSLVCDTSDGCGSDSDLLMNQMSSDWGSQQTVVMDQLLLGQQWLSGGMGMQWCSCDWSS
jgi:hypothetical protein